jgi:putative redox protein
MNVAAGVSESAYGFMRMRASTTRWTILTMTMTAVARSVDGGLRHEVDINGRHVIVTDEPKRLGGTDAGPAPHELLPAMLAACVSTMIILYARARNWELSGVRVEVQYDAESTPRHVALRVCLPEGLTTDQVRRLRRVAATCPAKRALEAGFTFDEQLIVGASELTPAQRM